MNKYLEMMKNNSLKSDNIKIKAEVSNMLCALKKKMPLRVTGDFLFLDHGKVETVGLMSYEENNVAIYFKNGEYIGSQQFDSEEFEDYIDGLLEDAETVELFDCEGLI